jgi:hypothetical protein
MGLLVRKSLGIALASRSMKVAEIGNGSDSYRVNHTAEFVFGESDSLQDPLALGAKFAAFLREHLFSARQAVFGLPAQWLMFREKMLPPAPPQTLQSMLAIQAERDFSLEPQLLTLDYVLGQASGDGQPALLVAALRERVEQVRTFAEAAGLKTYVITATTLALAAATGKDHVLYAGANGVELATRGPGGLVGLRHIATGSMIKSLAGQASSLHVSGALRRALVTGAPDQARGEITLWDDVGVEPAMVQGLALELGMPLVRGESFHAAHVEALPAAHAAGCVALALSQFLPALAPINLLSSRLAAKPPSRISTPVVASAVAALVVLIGAAYMFIVWRESSQEVAELRQKRDEMKENLDSAKAFVGRVNATRTWYERRPNYLECLRTVTLCFPEEGRAWTSSFTLRDDMKGILSGRAVDEKNVLDVLDRLKATPSLANVKMLYMRGTGGKNPEVSFGISFVFRSTE